MTPRLSCQRICRGEDNRCSCSAFFTLPAGCEAPPCIIPPSTLATDRVSRLIVKMRSCRIYSPWRQKQIPSMRWDPEGTKAQVSSRNCSTIRHGALSACDSHRAWRKSRTEQPVGKSERSRIGSHRITGSQSIPGILEAAMMPKTGCRFRDRSLSDLSWHA